MAVIIIIINEFVERKYVEWLPKRWADSYSRVIWLELGLNVWRKRNVLRLRLNRARGLQHKVSVFREFQTAGAEQRNAQSAKWVLVVGLWSSGVVEERRWRVDSRGLMWWLRYAGQTLHTDTSRLLRKRNKCCHLVTVWVKKNPPPCGFMTLFPKRMGIF